MQIVCDKNRRAAFGILILLSRTNIMNFKWTVILSFLNVIAAQDPNCDYYQYVEAGRLYYISNPGYPNNYIGNLQCRWIADCPPGYNCQLDCPDISIPESADCTLDRLLVSKSGDPQLTGSDKYCGRGTLSATSTGQRISVGLITNINTPGGRFLCELRAKPASPNPQCSCGERRQIRIVGGQPTGVNEYKMMVGLARVQEAQIRCGAVIISPQYVLTAAHCLVGERVADTAVIVGEHDVTVGDSPATRAYKALNFIIHPRFTESNFDYDIALIKVAGAIEYNDRVGPVCLPFKYVTESFAGKKATVLGWGTTEPGGPRSDVLLKANVDVISQAQCRRSVNALSVRQLCANTTGKDACQYDSGGPLLYTDPRTGLLHSIGIVSFGRSCASNDPGVYTRVTALLDWITSTTRTQFCVK